MSRISLSLYTFLSLFISVCSPIDASASDEKKYTFNDFDKNVFTNHVTHKVELFYPTDLIASISQEKLNLQKMVEIQASALTQLLYPALTRVVFRKQAFMLQCANGHYYLAQDAETKALVEQCWQNNNQYGLQLAHMYEKIKAIQEKLVTSESGITLYEADLMLIVQLAARKIERWSNGTIGIAVTDQHHVFASGDLEKVVNKYRIYEQQ